MLLQVLDLILELGILRLRLDELVVDGLDFLGVILEHCLDLLLGLLYNLGVELSCFHDCLLQIVDQLLTLCKGLFMDLCLLEDECLELSAFVTFVVLLLLIHECVSVDLANIGKLLLEFIDFKLEYLLALDFLVFSSLD